MIIYLWGADIYRRNKRKLEILEGLRDRNSHALIKTFDLSNEAEIGLLDEFIKAASLFSKKKICILENISELDSKKAIKQILKSNEDDKDVNLILDCNKKLVKEFDFLLKAPNRSEVFESLEGKEFENFLIREAGARKIKINKDKVISLAENFKDDSWGAVTELEKIGSGGILESNDEVPDFFSTLQRFKNGKSAKEKIVSLEYLLLNDDPAKIFNVLSSLMSPEKKKLMADFDIAIKSGKLEYREALVYLALI